MACRARHFLFVPAACGLSVKNNHSYIVKCVDLMRAIVLCAQTKTATPKTNQNMKKLSFIALLMMLLSFSSFAQETKPVVPKQFMQITTIESVVAGGLGRSRMIVTHADGTQTEAELNNLFSMAGINFGNIKENEDKVLRLLKQYTNEGWKIEQVIPLSLSPSQNGAGIFMTRYFLVREETKKAM